MTLDQKKKKEKKKASSHAMNSPSSAIVWE